MAYIVEFTRQAARALTKLPLPIVRAIHEKLEQIAEDPFAYHPNVTKLQNREGYRLRVNDWRVIYIVQKDRIVILVLKIGLRGEVYR